MSSAFLFVWRKMRSTISTVIIFLNVSTIDSVSVHLCGPFLCRVTPNGFILCNVSLAVSIPGSSPPVDVLGMASSLSPSLSSDSLSVIFSCPSENAASWVAMSRTVSSPYASLGSQSSSSLLSSYSDSSVSSPRILRR